jgi:hypothetical protein
VPAVMGRLRWSARPMCGGHDGLRRRLPGLSVHTLSGLGTRPTRPANLTDEVAAIRGDIDRRVRALLDELVPPDQGLAYGSGNRDRRVRW